MADRPLAEPLPADLPENWTAGQIIAPFGANVGLSEQHGYNYLMEQVNRAQRAANAINESFDSISGKRTCRFTVGTSTAGWTEADCDYLCDGVDDQVEIQAAIDAIAPYGGEIAILDGTYHLSGVLNVSSYYTWIHGNGESTTLVRETEDGTSGINYFIALYPGVALTDLRYHGNNKAKDGEFDIVLAGDNVVDNVMFEQCGYGCIYAQTAAVAGSAYRIRNCKCDGISKDTFVFVRAALGGTAFHIQNNHTTKTTHLVDCPESTGNVPGGSILISGNSSLLSRSAVSLDVKNLDGLKAFVISDNFLSKIELRNSAGYSDGTKRGALIYGNVLQPDSGDTAITLGPNTKNNFVFGNMLIGTSGPLEILDQGSGNIIFGNSDDAGSGGGAAGVSSFNGRSGAVTPQNGDYTAAQVGAIPAGAVTDIQLVTQTQYDALATKNATTLYLIKE